MPERDWYRIRAAADTDEAAEVLIYDQIGESFWSEGVTARQFAADLKAITAPRITLRINSPGGSVFDGVAIFNAIRQHPARVVTHVDGLAASIASVIALAGDEVHMAANALYMIHNPWGVAMGDARELRRTADTLDKVRDTMLATYRERCALTEEELLAALDAETWYSADEAQAAGFVDTITGAQQLAAAFDLSAFRNPPAALAAGLVSVAAAAPTVPPAPREDTMPEHAAAAAPPAPTPITPTGTPTASALPTPGQYVLATIREDHAALAAFRHSIMAAAPHTLVVDVPGIIPEPIVGPVLDFRSASDPLFSALGPNAAPAGEKFRIPYVSLPLEAAAAAAEKTDVTRQFKVDDVEVVMTYIKRAVNISAEAIAYSQPEVVDVALAQLTDAMALGREEVAASALEAATGTNAAVALAADGSDAWSKLAAAVAAFYTATGRNPSHFVTPVRRLGRARRHDERLGAAAHQRRRAVAHRRLGQPVRGAGRRVAGPHRRRGIPRVRLRREELGRRRAGDGRVRGEHSGPGDQPRAVGGPVDRLAQVHHPCHRRPRGPGRPRGRQVGPDARPCLADRRGRGRPPAAAALGVHPDAAAAARGVPRLCGRPGAAGAGLADRGPRPPAGMVRGRRPGRPRLLARQSVHLDRLPVEGTGNPASARWRYLTQIGLGRGARPVAR
jgi:ATP-dependent Clp endopeptidase proteolytic subunit ClpP